MSLNSEGQGGGCHRASSGPTTPPKVDIANDAPGSKSLWLQGGAFFSDGPDSVFRSPGKVGRGAPRREPDRRISRETEGVRPILEAPLPPKKFAGEFFAT